MTKIKYSAEQDALILTLPISQIKEQLGLTRGQIIGRRHTLRYGGTRPEHKAIKPVERPTKYHARFARPVWFQEDIWLLTKGGAS